MNPNFSNMETIKKFLEWLRPFPSWLRLLFIAIIGVVLALLSLFAVSACGTPKTIATVQNVNPNSTVTVTMSVSNAVTSTPTVDTNPVVNLNDSTDASLTH